MFADPATAILVGSTEMKRRFQIVAAVAALGLALWFWRSQRATPAQGQRPSLGSGAAANGSGAAHDSRDRAARVDPSTLPRASIAGTVKDASGVAVANAMVCADFSSDDISTTGFSFFEEYLTAFEIRLIIT